MMRKHNESLLADFFLMIFLLLTFISILFVIDIPMDKDIHIMVLGGIFLISVLTYFTSLTTGLMLAVAIDFIGLSVCLYMSITKGVEIQDITYFWIIMLPLFVISIGGFTNKVTELQKENRELNSQMQDLITVDEHTGLKNETAFMYDSLAYMNMAKRYNHELVFMAIGIRYPEQIRRLLGKVKMEQLILDISHILEESMRKEDVVYTIDYDKTLWGILMITNAEQGMDIIDQRVRDKVKNLQVQGYKKGRHIKVDLVIGKSICDCSMEDPIELLESAKRQMQYDV